MTIRHNVKYTTNITGWVIYGVMNTAITLKYANDKEINIILNMI